LNINTIFFLKISEFNIISKNDSISYSATHQNKIENYRKLAFTFSKYPHTKTVIRLSFLVDPLSFSLVSVWLGILPKVTKPACTEMA
jgi:hypothetical protein